jgi:hypothetical protein
VARVLGAVVLLLVVASLAGQVAAHLTDRVRVLGLVRLFYVDAERNAPTAFSTGLLLLAAALLGLISRLEARPVGSSAAHWAALSLGFLVMAADEAFEFHEGWVKPVRRLIGEDTLGVLFFAWVVPGAVLVLVVAMFFWSFVWRLPAPTRLGFLTAAALFLGGAVGMELIGGRFAELHGGDNATYVVIVTVEETLEMAGVIVFIRALLAYLADHHPEVRLRFERRPPDGAPGLRRVA